MSRFVDSWVAATLFALAVVSSGALAARLLMQARRGPPADVLLPLWLRVVWWPARLLAGPIHALLPRRLEEITHRNLTSVDLDSSLTPSQWFATRVLNGALSALLVLLVPGLSGSTVLGYCLLAGGAGYSLGGIWLANRRRERSALIGRDLPAYLDLLTVSVEAGASLAAGIRLIVESAPESPLRKYFERVLRQIRSGRSRAQAFSGVAEAYGVPALVSLATALTHAEASGMSLGAVLRAQGSQRTAERFAAAEKLAMQAPVKLLGPLILCIFPCTFVVLAIPILARLREAFAS